MRKPYHTIDDVLRSSWAGSAPPVEASLDRVLRSTKLEDSIYGDLRSGDSELDAIEQTAEFITKTAGELKCLLSDIGGDKGGLNTLEKLENALWQAQEKLSGLLDVMRHAPDHSKELEQTVIKAANQVESKRRQVEAVSKMIDASSAGNQSVISALVAQAVQSAAEKAEVQAIIGAWSDEPGI